MGEQPCPEAQFLPSWPLTPVTEKPVSSPQKILRSPGWHCAQRHRLPNPDSARIRVYPEKERATINPLTPAPLTGPPPLCGCSFPTRRDSSLQKVGPGPQTLPVFRETRGPVWWPPTAEPVSAGDAVCHSTCTESYVLGGTASTHTLKTPPVLFVRMKHPKLCFPKDPAPRGSGAVLIGNSHARRSWPPWRALVTGSGFSWARRAAGTLEVQCPG